MQDEEIQIKVFDQKVLPMLQWASEQYSKDPEIIANSSREKQASMKFVNDLIAQIEDFREEGGSDDRDNQDDEDIFGDDDIAVGPGRTTQTDFMDPPGDEDPDDDMDGFDTGAEGYDDGFPK